MTDVAVIILQRDESLHIGRCLERLKPLEARQVFVVDSLSTDGSDKLAERLGAKVVYHEWPGNQAAQFQWALDNLPIEAGWILRLDADEYLTDELIEEIKERLPSMQAGVDGVVFKRRHVVGWLGDKWVKAGMYPTRILRLFRMGRGHSDMKLMDEHIIVNGSFVQFKNDFVDHSLVSFDEWLEKHRGYATREARSFLMGEHSAGAKALGKSFYYRLPPYLRVVSYWLSRFFVRGAVLEGPKAWRWCWYHAMWYRWCCDCEIARLKKNGLEEEKETSGVNLAKYQNRHGIRNFFVRFVWKLVWTLLARPTPRWILNGWRVFILKCFKARIGAKCRVPGGTDIWYPSRLTMGRSVWIDVNVKLYCVNRITLGNNVIISDGAYLCTAQHDITDPAFALTTAPITIGDSAWIGARAIILPCRKIGEGAVVAAGAVVTRDVEPWTVVAGNPARVIKKRELKRGV